MLAQRDAAGVGEFPTGHCAAHESAEAISRVSRERVLPLARGLAEHTSVLVEYLDKLGVVDGGHPPTAACRLVPQQRIDEAGCLHGCERGGATMALVLAAGDGLC